MWAKLDDAFHSHPSLVTLGNTAFGLYARGISYCAAYLTDGELPAAVVASWLSKSETRLPGQLVGAGLWSQTENGFEVPGYLRDGRNPTRDQAQKTVEQKRLAGRRGAEQRWRRGTGAEG